MIAVRWLGLLMAGMLWCSLFAIDDPEGSAAARRLVATSCVALLAPLFWPGLGPATSRTLFRELRRLLLWSVAVAAAATLMLLVPGMGAQRGAAVAGACVMLFAISALTHGLAAWLEFLACARGAHTCGARERAGRLACLGLLLLGALPLWCGPLAGVLAPHHPWVIDAVIGLSPLTHLAVASGNDLLRNAWLYQHSNLAALPFDYPDAVLLAGAYAALGALWVLTALAAAHRRSRVGGTRIEPATETTT